MEKTVFKKVFFEGAGLVTIPAVEMTAWVSPPKLSPTWLRRFGATYGLGKAKKLWAFWYQRRVKEIAEVT